MLTLKEARTIIIKSQLLYPEESFQDKNSLLKIIEQLGSVQIDTISVVERSHHHILWSRTPLYQRTMLFDLLEKDKMIFEYWSHAAAYLHIKDFKYSFIRKRNYSKKYKTWRQANKKILNYVYDRIKTEGPLQSKDFLDYKKNSSGWWNWKPSKDALDFLFHEGKLMIACRKGFQKVYDLTERVLPNGVDTSIPTEREYYQHLITNSIKSNGLVAEKEMTYLRNYDKTLFKKTLNELVEDKIILEMVLNETNNEVYYTFDQKLKFLNGKNKFSDIHILSPFDNMLIQRKRMKKIFNFDYQLECYVPESKRKYGYFCLPILYGDRFIGKIDAKAFKEKKAFIINNLYLEEGIVLNNHLKHKLLRKLNQLAIFTECKDLKGLKF